MHSSTFTDFRLLQCILRGQQNKKKISILAKKLWKIPFFNVDLIQSEGKSVILTKVT